MKTLKLTPEQAIRIQDSFADLSGVLRQVKLNQLEGSALIAMKALEESVSQLEAFKLITRI